MPKLVRGPLRHRRGAEAYLVCLAGGAHRVQTDPNEARFAMTLDPSGMLPASFMS